MKTELDSVPSFQELARIETLLLLRQLEQRCQALGVSFLDLDKRLSRPPGFHKLLFSGEKELALEHLFAILCVLREDPGTFFSEVVPPNNQGNHPALRFGLKKPS